MMQYSEKYSILEDGSFVNYLQPEVGCGIIVHLLNGCSKFVSHQCKAIYNFLCQVLVAPYIPGIFQPKQIDYIVMNMQFNNVDPKQQAIMEEIENKLAEMYVRAKLRESQKRRKRSLGSIDAVVSISYFCPWEATNSISKFLFISSQRVVLHAQARRITESARFSQLSESLKHSQCQMITNYN